MAINSTFYDGTVDEVAFSTGIARVGSSQYGVAGAADYKVTAVTGVDRTVSIAAGAAWGKGIHDVLTAAQTIAIPLVSSGNRWDLIAVHRVWSTNTTTLVRIAGTSSRAIPAGRAKGFGTTDDQPIALVRVAAGQTAIQEIVDLRCFAGGGGLVAIDELAMSYLDVVGAQVVIGSDYWVYAPTTANNAAWGKDRVVNLTALQFSNWSNTGTIAVDYSSGRKFVSGQLVITRTASAGYGAPTNNAFSTLGAILPVACRGSAEGLYVPALVSGGAGKGALDVYINPSSGAVAIRSSSDAVIVGKGSSIFVNFSYYV